MNSEPDDLVKVAFVDGDIVETLWAKPLGNNQYCLDNGPWYAYRVSWRDVVEAMPPATGGLSEFVRVVRKSGNRTVRVILEAKVRSNDPPHPVLEGLKKLGCSYEGSHGRLFSINVPATTQLEEIRKFLIDSDVEWEHADSTHQELFTHAAN